MNKWIKSISTAALIAVCAAGCATTTTNSVASKAKVPAKVAAHVTDPNGETCDRLDAFGYCAGDDPTAAPVPTVVPPNKIEFVISGYAPGDPACGGACLPDITYGSNSATHDVQEQINGTVTFSMPFDPNAEFYSVNVNTDTPDSHLTCKIVVLGPSPDAPLTASSGSETGQDICSAQAAPTDATGESWNNEG